MCYLKEFERIDNLNEVQVTISRAILEQEETFSYGKIKETIDEVLSRANSPFNDYIVSDMIADTLSKLVDMGKVTSYNNCYTPNKKIAINQ